MERRWIAALGIAAIGLVVLFSIFSGGQTSKILSTVGSAVGTPEDQGSGGNDGTATAPAASPGSEVAAASSVEPARLLVVRKGSLTLETAAIAQTVSNAAGLVSRAGGFVAGSKENGADAAASAVVDYRIPAEAWEPTLAGLRALGSVRGQEITSEEVTGQVVDLGARIANLRATEAALQAIMARATRIQDVLDVQGQLTDTRGQIEELTAQKSGLEDRAAFGSLSVTFQLPPSPAPPATRPPGWDPARDVDAAAAKLVRIGQKGATAGIWFTIVGLPLLLALAIALVVAWLGWRAVTRIRRASEATGEAG